MPAAVSRIAPDPLVSRRPIPSGLPAAAVGSPRKSETSVKATRTTLVPAEVVRCSNTTRACSDWPLMVTAMGAPTPTVTRTYGPAGALRVTGLPSTSIDAR